MTPSVSLVIPIYNRAAYLPAAIESVLAQTHTDFELLLWDDGSTDDSVAIATHYAQRDKRLRVVAAAHQGQTGSLKAAIAQAAASAPAFQVPPEFVQNCVSKRAGATQRCPNA